MSGGAVSVTESETQHANLADEEFVSITTFKRDGSPVSTPVWVAGDNASLLVISEAGTWKIKRIRRDHHVRIAACSARGKQHGEPIDAERPLTTTPPPSRGCLLRSTAGSTAPTCAPALSPAGCEGGRRHAA